jgi:hypothetical protein
MKRLFNTTFLLAFSALAMIIPAHSQTKAQKKERKAFAAIPENLRTSLVERLNLYVEYERTKQYEKLYDLLLESVAATKGLGRDAYIDASKKATAEKHRSVLLKFKPTTTIALYLNDKDGVIYQIFGTAKVDDGEEVYEMNAAIDARLINEQWYFSGVGSVIYD